MISFIIIGKNIQNTIAICIESVVKFIETNNITSFEILYIDSNSIDESIKIAQQFPVIIFSVKGEVNAAIGRNVGAKNSKGKLLFFIDGDMELVPDFYQYVFSDVSKMPEYPFVNGYWQDKYYDNEFKFLYTEELIIPDKIDYINTTGGLMIVTKELWNKVGGMDERLVRSQDHDIGLRLAKIGFPAKRYNHLFATHHTTSYFDKKRFINFIFGKTLLSQGLLMRKQLFNIAYLSRYRNNIIYVLYLFPMFIALIIKPEIGFLLVFIYLVIHVIRVIKNVRKEISCFFSYLYKIMLPFYTLIGFLFYYPSKPRYTVTGLSNKKITTNVVMETMS